MDGPLRRHRAEHLHKLMQVEARQVFHHIVERAIIGAAIIENLHRVPVGQCRSGLHFPFEAGERIGIPGFVGVDQFQSAWPL